VFRDSYILDFLGLKDRYIEKDIEDAIVRELESFILELGAGFNLEFTGIENVYMSASLMGFSRKQTDELLPQIERFAEIGDFIHQPVKFYSSGMYVRLAFATAVSTEPQILIIDEALSVGDALFQHRCLRRIKQMQPAPVVAMLTSLGRIHSAGEARRAIELALSIFGNVNIDLMYGLPEQTLEQARADIEEGVRHGTPHLSAYQLSIEPNTLFFSHPPKLPEHDSCADMQVMVEDTLAQAGFEHYETSAFARAGRRCRHNLNYWEFGDYLGIGAGAHGKLSFADRVTRHERVKQPREYMAATGELQPRLVGAKELPFEFMLNALRLVEGFPRELLSGRTGLPQIVFESGLREAEQRGLVTREPQAIRPTERGRRFLNDLVGLFIAAPE